MIEIIKTEDYSNIDIPYCAYCGRQVFTEEYPCIRLGDSWLHRECAVAAAARIVNLFEQL